MFTKGECGCGVVHVGLDELEIEYCPMHKAADDMYEALKALIDHFRVNDENYYKSDLCADALEALKKAEGGK